MYLIPADYFLDESLESFILRISFENKFDCYSLLSGALKEHLLFNDPEAAGAFPMGLDLLNIYHANETSSFRVRALLLIEEMLGLKKWQLHNLAFKHSHLKSCGKYKMVSRQKMLIPKLFLRADVFPICPECLREASYIRQHWHYKPYLCCHEHKTALLRKCPECGGDINYLHNEQIVHCQCGYDFRDAATEKADTEELKLSQLIMGIRYKHSNVLAEVESASVLFSALLWGILQLEQGGKPQSVEKHLNQVVDYFNNWPVRLGNDLDGVTKKGSEHIVKEFNNTNFNYIYSDLLMRSRTLPLQLANYDFIHKEVVQFFIKLVSKNQQSVVPNIGDVLLTVHETASILCCSHDQIYQYYEKGILRLAKRKKLHKKLLAGEPAFFLRQVIELKLSVVGADADVLGAW